MAEAVYIARDVLLFIVGVGCRAVYVTHMHNLASGVDADDWGLTGFVVNLVATICGKEGRIVPTYRIERGEPSGRSFAAALAAEFGLSIETLKRERESPSSR